MRSLLPRRPGITPVVETLEDRRLPSQFGAPSGWFDPAQWLSNDFNLAPPIRGPMAASAKAAHSSAPGPVGGNASMPFEATDPAVKALNNDAFPVSWMAGPQTNFGADPAQAAWKMVATSNPAGDRSAWSEAPALATASPLVEPATSAGNVGRPVVARGPDTVAPAGQSTIAAAYEPTTRAASPAATPVIRSVAAIVQTPRGDGEASAHADAPGNPAADASSVAVVATLPVESSFAPGNPARGSASAGPANGPGSLATQARPALDSGVARNSGDGRLPGEVPPPTTWEPETAEGRAAIEGGEASRPEGAIEAPDPRLADLIMDLAPLARASLEGIVDRFLGPLDGLPPSLTSDLYGPMGLLAASLTLATTVLAVDVSLRIRRSRDEDGDERLVEFPGLPGLRGGTAG